ncbi:DUF3987 domain-containing protein [Kitasatospora sp. MBT66]|uniref:DUF3987 domain-containing protein n=1 Tax=Kitasatospora sp. MBT66 TaxID=1444769 RepID=UPI00068B6675|nr:DUF3987 domain-containing protein [Kitasatospora sp. MBT66]
MSTTFEAMKFGPLGDAVEAAMPTSEADPIGVWAAALSLYSAAISRTVRLDNNRPVVVWTVLAGRSGVGRKGYALFTSKTFMNQVIGGFLDTRTRDGISSGPSLVDMLNKFELETSGQPGGIDGRAMLVEEEWASVLKTQKRCPKFSTLFRTAWDGKTISNRTKKELQAVARPLLGFHAHITPGEWARYVSSSEALGGSYNRLLPVLVERSKMLTYTNRPAVVDVKVLKAAFAWATSESRVIGFDRSAGQRYDEIRAEVEDKMAELPELLSSYMERAAEQVHRIAAVLTATTRKTKITRRAVDAAWAFVSYSMASVEKLVREAADQAVKPVKSTAEMIREVLQRYEGEASSTILLRALGTRVTAASVRSAVESMPDVEMETVRTGGRGAPRIMYRLIEPEAPTVAQEPEVPKAPAVTEAEPIQRPAKRPRRAVGSVERPAGKPTLRVVGSPAPKRAKAKPKAKKPIPPVEPSSNPFLALL